MKQCDTLISAQYALTQNPERAVLENPVIAVHNGHIAAIGTQEAMVEWQAENRIALPHALLSSGLVNAHTHVAMTFLRGLADDMPLMDWLTHFIFPVESHLTAEIVEYSSLLGCAEMMRTGTTSFVDMYIFENAVCRAVDQSGLRVLAGEVAFTFASAACESFEENLHTVRALHEQWKHHPRIRACVMPHAVYTTSHAILTKCAELAEELGLPLHIHLAETPDETRQSMDIYGRRPVAVCADTGILGPTTSLAHVVDVTEEEIALLAKTGTKVAHNPKSNMKLSSGVSPIPAMLKAGMVPGLGTDGASSNNGLSMFSEMTACALLHKLVSKDPATLPAQTVYDMATLGSAAAFFDQSVGSLEPGKKADIIAVDLTSPNMQPMYSPQSHLVYATSGHDVCLTMVEGKVVYKDGQYLTFDYPALCKEMKGIAKWARSKIS